MLEEEDANDDEEEEEEAADDEDDGEEQDDDDDAEEEEEEELYCMFTSLLPSQRNPRRRSEGSQSSRAWANPKSMSMPSSR